MINRNQFIRILLSTAVIAVLAFAGLSSVQAQDGPPPLFGEAGVVKPETDGIRGAFIAQERYLLVNVDMLFDVDGRPLSGENLPRIALNLFSLIIRGRLRLPH